MRAKRSTGDHKAAMNRHETRQTQDINNTNDPQISGPNFDLKHHCILKHGGSMYAFAHML